VRTVTVDERGDGQRLDNFVVRECAAVPKTRLYRAIRKGEIRVNRSRARPEQRLVIGDRVRLPPVAGAARQSSAAPAGWQARLDAAIVYEDDALLVINKPAGIAVHGGSGLQFGLIETLRDMRPSQRFLELAHRLDRETSGLLLVAKRPAALRELHARLREEGGIDKRYLALVFGRWPRNLRRVDAPLERYTRRSGERMVRVAAGGKPSLTDFSLRELFPRCSLIEARPLTGRTHQIRVHAAHRQHPLLGDDKYANDQSRELTVTLGLRRLFLHAASLRFRLGDRDHHFEAPIGDELQTVVEVAARSSE
jgi:23S rRNA pseudouridine955/2504/2580 synthase